MKAKHGGVFSFFLFWILVKLVTGVEYGDEGKVKYDMVVLKWDYGKAVCCGAIAVTQEVCMGSVGLFGLKGRVGGFV